MLHDSVFDFVKSEMVFIEHFLSVFEVEIILCIFIPWKFDESFQIVVLNAIICRLWVHPLQFLKLFIKDFSHFFTPLFLRSLSFQILDILLVRRAAEFFLNSPKLLIQKVFALLLVHIFLNLTLDLLFQVDHLHLFGEKCQ